MEIFKQIADKDLPLEEDMDEDFRELVTLCLRKDPQQRADGKTLKQCSLFTGINFRTIFAADPPLDRKELQGKQTETL